MPSMPRRSTDPARAATLRLLGLLPLVLACGKDPAGGGTPTPAASEVCPRAADRVSQPGDANGDGVVDVADPVVVLRHAAAAGVAPACAAAVDLVPDGRVQLDDAFAALVALGEGLFDPGAADADDCGDAALALPTACQGLDVALSAPATAEAGVPFDATVTVASSALAVEAWSLAVSAEGCQVVTATTAGTSAAAVTSAPPGLRDLGYDLTTVADGAATSLVVLGFMDRVALPSDGQPHPVLALRVEAAECGSCTLALGAPARGLGPEIPSVVAAQDAAWPLPEGEVVVQICP
ncbi:hypothetical protein L6R53_07155 [Myxococcota bacterium]|nr:hypothetical protein [Myxococcota bacterium]